MDSSSFYTECILLSLLPIQLPVANSIQIHSHDLKVTKFLSHAQPWWIWKEQKN